MPYLCESFKVKTESNPFVIKNLERQIEQNSAEIKKAEKNSGGKELNLKWRALKQSDDYSIFAPSLQTSTMSLAMTDLNGEHFPHFNWTWHRHINKIKTEGNIWTSSLWIRSFKQNAPSGPLKFVLFWPVLRMLKFYFGYSCHESVSNYFPTSSSWIRSL